MITIAKCPKCGNDKIIRKFTKDNEIYYGCNKCYWNSDIIEIKEFNKITVGYVIQTFKGKNCISQNFIAGDQIDYELKNGESIHKPDYNYQTFDMIQPDIL